MYFSQLLRVTRRLNALRHSDDHYSTAVTDLLDDARASAAMRRNGNETMSTKRCGCLPGPPWRSPQRRNG
jgi:hypothetical protein